MGYIHTKPVEEVVRKTFRQKKEATFWELVQAGFPLETTLSYADARARENQNEAHRLSQYELALDICLKHYFCLGLVYPAKWREVVDRYLDGVRILNEWDGKGHRVNFSSNARLLQEFEGDDHWGVSGNDVFASPVCRAVNGWTKEFPPWFERPERFCKKPMMRACQEVVLDAVLPTEDANEVARPITWVAGDKLFSASYLGGVDL